jgi:hypothetical protein
MKPKDAFELIVRTFGLILIYHAVYNVLYPIFRALGIEIVAKNSATVDWVIGAIYLGFGIGLLFGGRLIARVVYGKDQISN